MRNVISTSIQCATLLGYQPELRPAERAGAARAATPQPRLLRRPMSTSRRRSLRSRAVEDQLVKSILIGYHAAAQGHLKAAARDAQGRVGHLEAAAAEVTNIANEGDKRIQAVRQRLAKAGHTHNTDVETKADYMFITNRERKGLVELAGKIGRAGEADLESLGEELSRQFHAAIADE